jgi:hypothetical protein
MIIRYLPAVVVVDENAACAAARAASCELTRLHTRPLFIKHK